MPATGWVKGIVGWCGWRRSLRWIRFGLFGLIPFNSHSLHDVSVLCHCTNRYCFYDCRLLRSRIHVSVLYHCTNRYCFYGSKLLRSRTHPNPQTAAPIASGRSTHELLLPLLAHRHTHTQKKEERTTQNESSTAPPLCHPKNQKFIR